MPLVAAVAWRNTGGGGAFFAHAGPDKTIALPASDLSLFGSVDDLTTGPFLIAWSQVSGPATAVFSAPWAFATTVSFTTVGTYVFRITVISSAGVSTDDVTVVVRAATDQTAFYVDPTYTGGGNDGSAAHPWTTELNGSSPTAAWTTINTALASNDVIVYFSARLAGSDTKESQSAELNIWRTDTSMHRLTLDGMSKYNTNDTTGSWLDYAGANKYKIVGSGNLSVGVSSNNTGYPCHYTTIRGFEVTSRITWAGDYSTIERCWAHDMIGSDPGLLFHGAVYSSCVAEFGNLQDITVRNNLIERTNGEGIYIAGNYILATDGGCPSWGNTHRDLLIEENTVTDAGFMGAQGDGIDLKAGLLNVTIRGNRIQQTDGGVLAAANGFRGIVSSGIFGTATTVGNYLIEQNIILDYPECSFQQNNGVTIRNNVFACQGGAAAMAITTDSNTSERNKNIALYNNTIYNGYIILNFQDGAYLRNNVLSGITSGEQASTHGTSTGLNSDYNAFVSTMAFTNWSEGANSTPLLHLGTASLFVNPAVDDYHLLASTVCVNTGISLAAGLTAEDSGFANDLEGTTRPQGAAWDLGAYERV
jgi:hypothetical protein